MTEYKDNVDHANVKIHPPVLLLIHLIVVFVLNWLLPMSDTFPKFLEWGGYGFVITGLGFAFRAMGRFRSAHTTLDPHGSVSAIVTGGPYRISRNPIYLGYVCLLTGLPLVLGNCWGVVLSPLLVIWMYRLVIKQEELYLEEKFKDVYTSYKSRVRRWL